MADVLFAAAQARLGQSLVRRLSNARISLAGGATVYGHATRRPRLAAYDGLNAPQADLSFTFLTPELGQTLDQGDPITLTWGNDPTGTAYLVTTATPDADRGITQLGLELPPA